MCWICVGYVWCEIRQQSSEEPCDETSFGKKKWDKLLDPDQCVFFQNNDLFFLSVKKNIRLPERSQYGRFDLVLASDVIWLPPKLRGSRSELSISFVTFIPIGIFKICMAVWILK